MDQGAGDFDLLLLGDREFPRRCRRRKGGIERAQDFFGTPVHFGNVGHPHGVRGSLPMKTFSATVRLVATESS